MCRDFEVNPELVVELKKSEEGIMFTDIFKRGFIKDGGCKYCGSHYVIHQAEAERLTEAYHEMYEALKEARRLLLADEPQCIMRLERINTALSKAEGK